jgi:hypothetical protein
VSLWGYRSTPDLLTLVLDPVLTQNGRYQSDLLNYTTKHTFQKTAELLVTSGLKRSMQTMIVGYPWLRKRLEEAGTPVMVLPQLQEVSGIVRSSVPRTVLIPFAVQRRPLRHRFSAYFTLLESNLLTGLRNRPMFFVFSPAKSSQQTPNFQDLIFRSSRQIGVRRRVSILLGSQPSKSGHGGYAVGCATDRRAKSSSLPMKIFCIISPME